LLFCSLSRCGQWARRCWCCWCEHLISRRSCVVRERSRRTWRRRRAWALWRCRLRSFEISWRLYLMLSVYPCSLRSIVCLSYGTFTSVSLRITTNEERWRVLAYYFMIAFSSPFFTNRKAFLQRCTLFLQTRIYSDKDIFIMIPRQRYMYHGSRHHPLDTNLYPSSNRCTSLQ
jgi:hypothetical protein